MIKVISDEKHKEFYLNWVKERVPVPNQQIENYSYQAFEINKKTVAVIIFADFDGNNMFIHLAIDDKKAVQRRFIKLMFNYVFVQSKANRVTGQCDNDNDKIKKLMEGVGFKKEGVVRQVMETDTSAVYKDAAIYGMLKEECRWIGK